MYAEISAAIQSAKSLGELLKAANTLKNYNEFVAAVADVSAKLMDATAVALRSQERQAELMSEVAELKREVERLRAVQEASSNYALHKFETGALVYKLLETSVAVPEHFLCAKCFDSGTHSKLQPLGNYSMHCHVCDSKIQVKFQKPAKPRVISRGEW